MLLNISNIQHFSVGDGNGIRTTVFFKGCNLRCPWCHNPENLSFEPSSMFYESLNKTEVLGRKVTVSEILPELLEDKDFFIQSGGGVTFSGGEVMLQADAAAELAKELYAHNVSVLVDTAGCVSYSEFKKLNPYVQGYLFDFKTADSSRYKKIGGSLRLVTENITRLLQEKTALHIRIPLIPDFNTDSESVTSICTHLKQIGINEVELLSFHRLGSGKYKALGLEYEYADVATMTKNDTERIMKEYSEKGLNVIKGG